MTVTLKDHNRGNEREFETREEAEERKEELRGLGASKADLEIIEGDESVEASGDNVQSETEIVEDPADNVTDVEPSEELPDKQPELEQDPVEWMPDHFVDDIKGIPTVNRKGYCMIASKYGVSVTAEPVTKSSATDFEYAEFKAVAETEDGRTYSGFGSAHVDRDTGDGGDSQYLLNEMAETRALKRACAWATGIGLTAIEELQSDNV